MEPRIQYAKTSDGVSIAYWTLGEGPPLVMMPRLPWSHTQAEWQIPPLRLLYEGLARNRRLVRYDGRGTGLSDRVVWNYSLDALMLDLDSVVERLSLKSFDLLGIHHSGPAAVVYAAYHLERVRRLILWSTWVRASDYLPPRQMRAIEALSEGEWELFTETSAHFLLGWPVGDLARHMAMFMRECVSPEARRAFHEAMRDFNVADRLAQIRAPTLVLQERNNPVLDLSVAKGIASEIPDARLAVLGAGGFDAAGLGNMESVLAVIDEFLGEGESAAPTAGAPATGAFRTVLFTDLVGHTEMMSRLGDERGREVLREHERITREVLKQHGGTEVKTMGDGFMASFGSVTRAVECAMALQRAMGTLTPDPSPAGTGEGQSVFPLKVRCGLNAGEPIEEEGDLFGATVILAARIAARAEGGEILVANAVRELCSGKGFLFADRGEFVAKGFEEPVRVYEVSWREE